MTTAETTTRDRALVTIAAEELGLDTIEDRGLDGLDFHDLHVASVRAALEAAYEAGRAAGPGIAPRYSTMIHPDETGRTPDLRTWSTIAEARAYALAQIDAGLAHAIAIGNGDGTDVVEVVR